MAKIRKECGSASTKQAYSNFWKKKASGWTVKKVETISPARKTYPGKYCATLVPKKSRTNR